MATICAGRCKLSDIAAVPEEVMTFGSPRVGNRRYVRHAGLHHVRWVNNNDIVARVPPTWLRYGHIGERHYMDRHGAHRKFTARQRAEDRWAGFVAGMKSGRFDHFSDHTIVSYVENLKQINGG